MFILIKNGIWLVNKWCMLRFISTSFVIMLISTTQAPCVKKVKPQRTGQASKTTNIVASVEAQLSYYCSSCRSLLIPPHSQDILMLPMQVNDKWENTTIMFIAWLKTYTICNMSRSSWVTFTAYSVTCNPTCDGKNGYILSYIVQKLHTVITHSSSVLILWNTKSIKGSISTPRSNHCWEIRTIKQRIFWTANSGWIGSCFFVTECSPLWAHINYSGKNSTTLNIQYNLSLDQYCGLTRTTLRTCHPPQDHILNISDHQLGNLQSKEHLDGHCNIFYWHHT